MSQASVEVKQRAGVGQGVGHAAWVRMHRLALLSLLVVGVLYLAGLAAMPPEGLTHHDTGAKYLQVRNLRLTPAGLDYSINYPARSLDPDLQFVPFQERQHFVDGQGRIYLQWPIFLGLLTRIPWKVMGFWGLYVVPFLAGLGMCWATYLLALAVGIPRRVAWMAVPLVGLATPLSIYALLFFEHTLAALLVALSLLFTVLTVSALQNEGSAQNESKIQNPKSKIAISGALLAVAVYFRSDLYVLVAVTGLVYLLMALSVPVWRRLLLWWLGAFALALVPLWAFYALTEGTLLPLHATWYFAGSEGPSAPGEPTHFELPALRYIVNAGWGIIPDSLLGPQTFPSTPQYPTWVGVLGVGGTALCAMSALMGLLRGRLAGTGLRLAIFAVGLAGVGAASAYILLNPQYYRNLHGFLVASPFIALALWPPREIVSRLGLTRHGLLYVITLGHVALHTLVISALSGLGPISRHEWGQRYLFNAYPGLVVLALLTGWRLWDEFRPDARVRRAALAVLAIGAALAVLGLVGSVRGYTVLYDERTQVRAWQDLARTLPGREPLVTDAWWLPLNLAADFYARPMMLADGDDRLAQWANQMREHGVTRFGFMTDKPEVFGGAWEGRVPGLVADGPPEQVRGIWMQRYALGP